MRVLWFTHLPADALNRHFNRPTTGSGFWIHALVQPLVESGKVDLAIATATPGLPHCEFDENGVRYFNVPQNLVLEMLGLFPRLRLHRDLRRTRELVERWRPDLIHVHGTERFFGLLRARKLVSAPTVVSIQGIVSQVWRQSWGAMTWRDVFANTTLWDITHNATMPMDSHRHWRQMPIEREILRGVDGVVGRTAWDHAHVRQVNPKVRYFHVDEVMRDEFMTASPWSPPTTRQRTLMTISSSSPLKGLPVLLKAVAALRRWGHDVRLKVAGLSPRKDRRASAVYVFKLIRSLGLESVVELLGWVNSQLLVEHLKQSSCFITPSHTENGCNALSEAQLLGLPCVATHTGGMTTTIRDGETGLLFSCGDEAMLALQIERILMDDSLAARLGAAARQEARRRHDRRKIVEDLLACYRSVAAVDVQTATPS